MKVKHYFYSGIQRVLEFLGKYIKNASNIYMFHQVNDQTCKWLDDNFCITKQSFQIFIDTLLEKGYEFRKINSLPEAIGKKSVFITFDDIFLDAFENAIPYLILKKIPFCVFIAENYIGKEGYISQEQKEFLLQEPLCTVGFHTQNHIVMRNATKKDIRYEVMCPSFLKRSELEENCFAFPYGSLYACNFFSIMEAKKQGYKYCFSTLAFPVTFWLVKHIPFFLPRININEFNYRNYLG